MICPDTQCVGKHFPKFWEYFFGKSTFSLSGKVKIRYFWFPPFEPCRNLIPVLEALKVYIISGWGLVETDRNIFLLLEDLKKNNTYQNWCERMFCLFIRYCT